MDVEYQLKLSNEFGFDWKLSSFKRKSLRQFYRRNEFQVNTYGADSDLYPSEPRLRAVIDQRLYFDMGTFYKAMFDCCVSIF